jgi:hypothetical protein
MRQPSLALLVLLAVACLPVVATAQEATPAAGSIMPVTELARTNIRYVSPFTPDGLHPGLNVTATEEGVCGHPSADAIGRPDAWDCISESDLVYDPCFENPFPQEGQLDQVACFDSPFSTDVVVLNLTEPLNHEKEAIAARQQVASPAQNALAPWDLPWALELGNGEQCTLFGGTLTVVAGQVAHYGCAGGGMVLGETDRGQPIWVVSYIAEGEYVTTLVDVVTAWS